MLEWLETGTDIQKEHAASRIEIGFDNPPPQDSEPFHVDWEEPEDQVMQAAQPVQVAQAAQRFVPFMPEVLAAINACPHRDCKTGCEKSLCHAGRGDQWGQTTLENCRDCLISGRAPS